MPLQQLRDDLSKKNDATLLQDVLSSANAQNHQATAYKFVQKAFLESVKSLPKYGGILYETQAANWLSGEFVRMKVDQSAQAYFDFRTLIIAPVVFNFHYGIFTRNNSGPVPSNMP